MKRRTTGHVMCKIKGQRACRYGLWIAGMVLFRSLATTTRSGTYQHHTTDMLFRIQSNFAFRLRLDRYSIQVCYLSIGPIVEIDGFLLVGDAGPFLFKHWWRPGDRTSVACRGRSRKRKRSSDLILVFQDHFNFFSENQAFLGAPSI